jgi:RNA polymerase sigma-70 factor (ECF subfamily)
VEREAVVTRLFVPLVEAARSGGVSELEALVRAVWPYAYRISQSILHDRALAEDAAQEACAVLFRHIKRLRAAPAFTVWFYRIVVREALAIRKRAFATTIELEPSSSSLLDDVLTRIEVLDALMELLAPQRVCVALSVCGEMSSREIGAVLEISDSTVRFHIMRARRTLEKSLSHLNEHIRSREETPDGAA